MTDEIKPFVVTFEEDGQRLDKWINFHFNHVSKIMMEKLCRTGQIRVNSSRVKPNFKLIENQIIRIPNFIRKKTVGLPGRLGRSLRPTHTAMGRPNVRLF